MYERTFKEILLFWSLQKAVWRMNPSRMNTLLFLKFSEINIINYLGLGNTHLEGTLWTLMQEELQQQSGGFPRFPWHCDTRLRWITLSWWVSLINHSLSSAQPSLTDPSFVPDIVSRWWSEKKRLICSGRAENGLIFFSGLAESL